MSPEDDIRSETRVPTIDVMSAGRGWQPLPQSEDDIANSTSKFKGDVAASPNTSPLKNGRNGITKNVNGCHTWSPLLPTDERLANNNDWSKGPSHLAANSHQPLPNRDTRNGGWRELPQSEEQSNGKHSGQGNNNSSLLVNGKTGFTHPKNGHADKMPAEADPLTGRRPFPEDETSCGIGSCKPKWARSFATTHVFMVVFLLAWILQGMYYTYFVSVITTIEKLFQIKSKTTGMLMSATEVGQISTALFLTYYAGRGHRPRWIACGMVLFAIASFGCTLPHFIYGDQLLHASNVFNGIGGNSKTFDSASQGVSLVTNSPTSVLLSESNLNLCLISDNNSTLGSEGDCQSEILVEQENHSQLTTVVLVIFFVSLLGVGVGQTAVSTLGIPYIDDNVASRESPIYIAITIGVRILGPAAGFILGSFCTRVYVNISVDPGIGPADPKWVGAWWLGLVLVSSLMALTSLAMFSFPKHLRGNRIPPPEKMRAIEAQKKMEKQEEEYKTPQLKDFPKTIKRQLRNDILMFRTASSVLHLLPVAGLYTFLPKYMESQFRLTAHDANLISGVGGILVMGVGIVISGVVILKFSPTARSVAAWIAFTAMVYACGMAILMFVGCPMDDLVGFRPDNRAPLPKFEPPCNLTCQCDMDRFSPICGSDGLTYFSSCHAGCNASITKNGQMTFTGCQCIPPNLDSPYHPDAVSGYCDGNCKNFWLFISLFSFFVFMHSTSEVGSMLLIMRCTDPKDKAMAMGIIQFAIGLFGNVPCPIIYGAVVDSACLVWETVCGKPGACSLYNITTFRHLFLGATAGIMALAFLMDLVVWKKAHRIDIDPGSNSETDQEKSTVPESRV
ncbi:solute carrier organic anion transporter family member 74D [Phlebotomus argentipes]|uniref:solute carrier organic anion transporter family member 74D n=1 Tax=Phlebotomus argentipes TaxID=94469 RepID=UPI0028936BFB|nr:solute carrier organic anion transporter family member 74D [Phlebotomus argentipes]XP_059612897.1 solute carrier organic anion transporter family member 74D [Phlebotomus argentipes]XP_059612898.1 solute carrier organic anion transporter family member 74D [Phlebotomus argentipes]